ncbi:PEP-utilizing enzyme [Otariodibacter sp.]|uniref:PEP-utilizing enzyme n=1 Tax=Otariodibacter sp. TaxID=3030919 RepID=UPI003417D620
MQARALDIKDLRHRILHNLAEQPIQIPRLHENDILLADELYPSTLAKLLNTNFRGICLAQGDPLSHTALLAKSAKIPLIIQCGESLMQHQQGDKLQIDWVEGKVKSL